MLFIQRNCCVRLVSLIPVLIVFGIIGFAYFSFVVTYVGQVIAEAQDPFSVPAVVAEAAVLTVLVALLVWSYVRVVATHPGLVPRWYIDQYNQHVAQSQSQANDHAAAGSDGDAGTHPQYRYCKTCQAPKAPRSHHCSLCGTCNLKMDHHCPWVGNCVGYANHKYFIQFLAYAAVSGLYVGLMLIGPLLDAFSSSSGSNFSSGFQLMLTAVLCAAFGVTLVMFAAFHIWLVAKADTTIEMGQREDHEVNIYDLGTTRNLEQVFGVSRWRWFLPVKADGVIGDGVHWPTRTQTAFLDSDSDAGSTQGHHGASDIESGIPPPPPSPPPPPTTRGRGQLLSRNHARSTANASGGMPGVELPSRV